MLHTTLLAIVPVTMSQTWSPTIAIVMVAANVLGVLTATVAKKAGPSLVGGFTVAQLIGGTCFGHLLGAGAILGLTQMGII
jgi:photosystem I subunit X